MVQNNESGGLDSQHAFDYAAEHNMRVVEPDDETLLLDLDTEEAFTYFKSMVSLASKYITHMTWVDRPSKSGLPHRHVVITMGCKFTVWQRIALQAILGSDRKRDLFSFARVLDGDEHPILLLESKEVVS